MKMATPILLALSIFTSLAAGAADYNANHCEIFIDKIHLSWGSHSGQNVTLFVKTLNQRLDSAVAEVGFYSQLEVLMNGAKTTQPWARIKMDSFLGAKDYFMATIHVGSDFGSAIYKGSFYVRTVNGTTYWAKDGNGNNFEFNRGTSDWLQQAYYKPRPPFFVDPRDGVATQREELAFLNPGRCN